MTSSILVANNPMLDVRDLHVDFINGDAVTHAVRGVSFQLGREKLAIVGESGSVNPPSGGRCYACIRPKRRSAPRGCSLAMSIYRPSARRRCAAFAASASR